MGRILEGLNESKKRGKKMLAVLLDPDKSQLKEIPAYLLAEADLILVGSSSLTQNTTQQFCENIKALVDVPVVLFPGNSNQICDSADGILFTSLTSGRNPEFLISQQVTGAPLVKKAQLEPIGTGYLMIESGKLTAAHYVSQSMPIPKDKPELAASTALAGEMFGFQATYLEAGSGADTHVPVEMVAEVRNTVNHLLFVGGGIKNAEQAEKLWFAGADIVVIGSVIEDSPDELEAFILSKVALTKSHLSS